MFGYKTQVALTILTLFTLHVAILFCLASFVQSFETIFFTLMMAHMFAMGLTQWLYVIPLALWFRKRGQRALLHGLMIGAGLTLLANIVLIGVTRFTIN